MTVPVLAEADLDELALLAADLSFEDAERRAVLLEGGSRDVNAAPGSGKTTLLAAKLLLMARKWPHTRRGICVLSHTNVARDEISHRLAATAEGARLLAYPHFIGTIHAFVNQYLALPLMRSVALDVDLIDDDTFARRAVGLARANPKLRFWMDKDNSVQPMVESLVYRGPQLDFACERGSLPKPTAQTYPILKDIKKQLTERGVYRFADLFSFAEVLLDSNPGMQELLSRRFPMAFVDEMQDTSLAQEELLTKLFAPTVVMQRFGDVNQRILGGDAGVEKLTFPRDNSLSITTSKRFGPAIAAAVAAVQLDGKAVVGDADDAARPVLLLYGTDRAAEVVKVFGRLCLERFSDEQLLKGKVRALCARKQGAAQASPGRHLVDYWPAYGQEVGEGACKAERLWALLASPTSNDDGRGTLVGRAADVRRALLLVLRAAGSTAVEKVRDAPALMRALETTGHPVSTVRSLCLSLALSRGLAATEQSRGAVPAMLYPTLQPFLPQGMSIEQFKALAVFEEPDLTPATEVDRRVCIVESEGRRVEVQIGTIASMKGETHLATLCLEAHGGKSRKFDLQEALPIMAGLEKLDPKMSNSLAGQFRNLYVAMSRPTGLLCVAVNASRATGAAVDALQGAGWDVLRLE